MELVLFPAPAMAKSAKGATVVLLSSLLLSQGDHMTRTETLAENLRKNILEFVANELNSNSIEAFSLT